MGSFGEILNWTITASSIIVIIFLIRWGVGNKLGKTYQCALWGIVLLRLLFPMMPSSSLSLFNMLGQSYVLESQKQNEVTKRMGNWELESVMQKMQNGLKGYTSEGTYVGAIENAVADNVSATNKDNPFINDTLNSEASRQEVDFNHFILFSEEVDQHLYCIWLVGALVVGGYYTYGYTRAKRKIKALERVEDGDIIRLFERCKEKVRLSSRHELRLAYWDTSMIFGIHHPIITIPKGYSEKTLEVILLHELTHYKYKDHWQTYVQLIALSLHWFNPLVWLAVKQMKEDMEFACDERVIGLGISKKSYAETLLNMIKPIKTELAFVQGMGDAPKQTKNRIQKITTLKQRKTGASIISMALVAFLTVGCLTDGTKSETKSANKWTSIQNVAMLGLDQDGLRTDTIVVAHMNCENGDVDVVSIPRDTKIVLDDEEKEIFKTMGIENLETLKINEIFAYGREAVIQSVLLKELEKLLEVEINHYVLINLEEAKHVVDALGGIEVNIPQAMDYDDDAQDLHIHLEQGVQHLDGEETMQAVRYRRYPNGDVDRVMMTQTIMKGILESALKISSLEEFETVVQSVKETLTTNMSLIDMMDYYTLLKKINLDHVSWNVLPGQGDIGEDGRSYYIVDEQAKRELTLELQEMTE